MPEAKPVWFPFYTQDFLGSPHVACMTTEEIGAYVLMLIYAWNDSTCSLPDNDDELARLTRLGPQWKSCSERLRGCFISKNNRLVNVRLTIEKNKTTAIMQKCSKAGKLGNLTRWNGPASQSKHKEKSQTRSPCDRKNIANHNHNLSLSKTLSLIPTEACTKTGALLPSSPEPMTNRFDEFWIAWPKKASKKDSRKAWDKLAMTDALFDEIMTGLAHAKDSPQWTKDGGQFIPHAATWLNGERWKDSHAIEGLGSGLWVDDFLRRHRDDPPQEKTHHDDRGVLKRLSAAHDPAVGTSLRGEDGYGLRSS